jgi:glc operon protein GlcG
MPLQKSVLSLEEARRAMDRMLEEANKEANRPVAIAIVDDLGELICYARMNQTPPQPQIIARKKAYTAARTRSDTVAYAERLKNQGRSVTEFGDPNLLALQGGVVITNPADGSALGGIGVSGRLSEEDEALGRIGLKAMFGG